MSSTEWQLHEHVCALLERALSPGASIRHDVRLPVLGANRFRQCDVVAQYGEPPRQLTAIVEVTSRRRRVGVNDVHAWYRKMQEVGAQLLICVASHGFSESAVNVVEQRYGPSVRLHALAEFEASVAGADGLRLGTQFTETALLVRSANAVAEELASTGDWIPYLGSLPLDTNERVFRLGSRDPVSLWELSLEAVQALKCHHPEKVENKQSVELSISCAKEPILLVTASRSVRIKSLDLVVEQERRQLEPVLWSYREVSTEQGLAWVQILRAEPSTGRPERVIGWLPTGTGTWFPVPLTGPAGSGHRLEIVGRDDDGNELVLCFPDH